MFILEKRPSPSRFWTAATPVLAVLLTMIAGGIMFAHPGQEPGRGDPHHLLGPAVRPQFAIYSRPQLLVKAGPLILIAIGLSLGLPGGDLEHRGRGAVHHGRDLRRGGGAGVLSGRALVDLSADGDGRGLRRLGSGR